MLIYNKDDIEFVTEFPCFLGHPVVRSLYNVYIIPCLDPVYCFTSRIYHQKISLQQIFPVILETLTGLSLQDGVHQNNPLTHFSQTPCKLGFFLNGFEHP